MIQYLARIKLPAKVPGDYGFLYFKDGGIWLHNINRGWDTSERIPCQERDAREVISMCWYDPVWELEMIEKGDKNG